MSPVGATLSKLRHGFPAQEADRRILEWARLGMVMWGDPETRTTRTRPVCPRCFGGVRVVPLGYECSAGCGWEHVRQDTEGY